MTPSAPTPLRPACSKEGMELQACHNGGCGFWYGFGMIETSLISYWSLFQENLSCVHIFGTISNVCWSWSRVESASMLKVRHSGTVLRASPICRRPLLRWSRKAARSAMRIAWLKREGASTAAWPTLIWFVCWAMAVSISSGAELKLNSTAVWCSTSHQQP